MLALVSGRICRGQGSDRGAGRDAQSGAADRGAPTTNRCWNPGPLVRIAIGRSRRPRNLGYLGESSPAVSSNSSFWPHHDCRVAIGRAAGSRVARAAAAELSIYPAVTRDLNLEVAEEIPWADLEQTTSRIGR